jgi:serine/threonine protein kinase
MPDQITHRDIKPSNLLLDLRDSVGDSFIWRSPMINKLTHSGDILGTHVA